jgi:hypothetical protein
MCYSALMRRGKMELSQPRPRRPPFIFKPLLFMEPDSAAPHCGRRPRWEPPEAPPAVLLGPGPPFHGFHLKWCSSWYKPSQHATPRSRAGTCYGPPRLDPVTVWRAESSSASTLINRTTIGMLSNGRDRDQGRIATAPCARTGASIPVQQHSPAAGPFP